VHLLPFFLPYLRSVAWHGSREGPFPPLGLLPPEARHNAITAPSPPLLPYFEFSSLGHDRDFASFALGACRCHRAPWRLRHSCPARLPQFLSLPIPAEVPKSTTAASTMRALFPSNFDFPFPPNLPERPWRLFLSLRRRVSERSKSQLPPTSSAHADFFSFFFAGQVIRSSSDTLSSEVFLPPRFAPGGSEIAFAAPAAVPRPARHTCRGACREGGLLFPPFLCPLTVP